ncbi:hypothetical protein N0V90_004387 [Kalmusia sp. IMI 367209]|nr:hypothetical protein N0V90_004387 [Kalmusia sp. IMI 367209]
MASRVAFDLALHKDMAEYVAKSVMTQEEADLRRTVFWGAYLVDHTVSVTLEQMSVKTINALKQWKADLPEALEVDVQDQTAPYLPHVLFMQYTFRRINIQGPAITCSAALLLIFADVSQYARLRGLNVAPYLGVCFRALDEFGQCWESAKRARDFLVNAQKQWQLKARSRRNVRRRSDTLPTSSQGSRKKRSLTSGFDPTQSANESLWPQLDMAHPPSETIQIASQDVLGQLGSETQSDDGFGLQFDVDFGWVANAGDQAVSNTWIPNSFTNIL